MHVGMCTFITFIIHSFIHLSSG